MTRIVLTRHGETMWNIEGRVQGYLDSPLTEKGIHQAGLLAAKLSQEKISYIYSSDLARAVGTAEEIRRKLGLKEEVILSPKLRELSFGEWEGKVWSQLREKFPEIFSVWDKEPHRVQVPGGENFSLVTDRAWEFLLEIIKKHNDETICIVSHGLTLKLLVTKALGFGVHEWTQTPWQHNTALNIIEFKNDQFIPVIIGDCSHLE